jgi:lipoprotein-releasing system permease protein
MFHPVPLYVGLRYVRSRSGGFFASFISAISMLGICVGVGALITIISVMNGLEREFSGRLLSLASHATLAAPHEKLIDWESLAAQIRKTPGVVGVAPYLELQGMLGRGGELQPAMVRGVLPEVETQVSGVGEHMVRGVLGDLAPGSQRVILGASLALQLDARIGDELTVLVPTRVRGGEGAIAGLDLEPRVQMFIVSGVFEVGAQEVDGTTALVHLEDAEAFAGTQAPGGLRLRFADIYAAPEGVKRIAASLAKNGDGEFETSDWAKENASYFRAVGLEKTMMTLILMLVVAVAAFNIIAVLIMVVNDKRTDIAILRTLGISRRAIVAVFMTQGVIIGWVGALAGFALGLTLALNVETIVPMLEKLLGMHIFDPTVYYISQVPSEVHPQQVAMITVTALVLTVLATIYPAMRGARTEPAEALRYE